MKLSNLFLFFFLIFSFSNSYANDKIVFVDLDYLLSNSKNGKKILDDLNELNNKNIKKFKLEEKKLNEAKNEIKNLQNIISVEEYQEKITKLKEDVKKYDLYKNDTIKLFEKTKNSELNLFFKNLNEILSKYMKENLISVILDKKNIVMSQNKNDITKEILNIINNND
ncbi:OmpH family outer membrane protein [Candidatus Pelagibacter sp. HIMB1493]|uniref:OmpH family outer membrane protein n=1 Tax=Candidatus Pelagibacter sp. HIMB1493 TaxID=3413334 RepID=UPI003F83F322